MKYFILILLNCFLLADYSGGYPGASFNYGTNAREIALSRSTISTYNRGFNAFINPALLPQLKNNEYGFSYFLMSLGRSIQSVSISRPLPPSAGVGLSFFRVGTNNIIETNTFGSEIGSLSHYEGYGMLSFGIDLGSLSGGFNIKAYFNDLYDYSGTGIGFDLGLLYERENINFAIKINNISSSYSWDIGSQQYEENIPTNYAIGFSYNKFKNLLLSTQINMIPIIVGPSNNSEKIYKKFHFGAEYILNYKDKMPISIMMGLKEINNKISYSLGSGLPIKITEKIILNFDYALDLGLMDEGISQLISLTLVNY